MALTLDNLFDNSYYLEQHPDVADAVRRGLFTSGEEHFNGAGKSEGRSPSAYFNSTYYLTQNIDVANAVSRGETTALDHFIFSGQYEGRNPNILFDTGDYLSQNEDILAAVNRSEITAFEHFIGIGQYEGRNPSNLVDNSFYEASNPDVITGVGLGFFKSSLEHLFKVGLSEDRFLAPLVRLESNDLLQYGPSQVEVGNGLVRSYIKLDTLTGIPLELGIEFQESVLSGLPPTLPFYPAGENVIEAPERASSTVFNLLTFTWVPGTSTDPGHGPTGIYDLPHFDMHFYLNTREERQQIRPFDSPENLAKAIKSPPPGFLPANYKRAVNSQGNPIGVAPGDGSHWNDSTAPEFLQPPAPENQLFQFFQSSGQPFTKSVQYGFYDGRMTLLEPMVTKAYLETKRNFSDPLSQPEKYFKTGYFPTTYDLDYQENRDFEYRISLGGFVFREASPIPPDPIAGPSQEEQVNTIRLGAANWNEFRSANPNLMPDLSGADLFFTDLSGINLSDSLMANVILEGANLTSADLRNANLRSAFMFGSSLNNANLSGAHLVTADLSGVDLSGANLSNAQMNYTFLLAEANLSNANLSGADLSNANLFGANLAGANFSNAKMTSTFLSGVNLAGATMIDANMRSSILSGSNLTGANFSGALLKDAQLRFVQASGANFSGADLHYVPLRLANLRNADLTNANLNGADLTGADLTGANLTGANILGANFFGAVGADLTGTVVRF